MTRKHNINFCLTGLLFTDYSRLHWGSDSFHIKTFGIAKAGLLTGSVLSLFSVFVVCLLSLNKVHRTPLWWRKCSEKTWFLALRRWWEPFLSVPGTPNQAAELLTVDNKSSNCTLLFPMSPCAAGTLEDHETQFSRGQASVSPAANACTQKP